METNQPQPGNQVAYWDRVAQSKTFSLPIDLSLLSTYLPLDSKILDYGCGYGRVCQQLAEFGFSSTRGIDSSPEMIGRARQMYPKLHFDVGMADHLHLEGGSLDAILLIAVLTCIPFDADQRQLIHTLRGLLRVGGILYLSDYVLQTDERNRCRYDQHAGEFGTYGIFRLPEGGIFRHHSMDWIVNLMADFATIAITYVDVVTMNGHPARAFQYCCQKQG